jgi:hypothetical protein
MVEQIQVLIQFLLGDVDRQQMFSGNSDSNQRLRELIPVVQEYAPQLREFGSLLVVRLTEKSISRGLNWATSRGQPVPS